MRGEAGFTASAHFIDGPSGRLFALHHAPRGVQAKSGLVYVAPFAEEMNRARRTAALQAQAFAAAGFDVLLLDLFGTGDSQGDFADAEWEIWLADVAAAATWLADRGVEAIGLWGLRLGALIGLALASESPVRFSRLLLWHPVLDGKAMLTQFLRFRVAAAMRGDGTRETTEMLRAALCAGESIEVAGYEICGKLARSLDGTRIDRLPTLPRGMRIDLLEVGDGQELALPARRALEHWREAGASVSGTVVPGEQFWAVQEAEPAMALIDATTGVVQSWKTS